MCFEKVLVRRLNVLFNVINNVDPLWIVTDTTPC